MKNGLRRFLYALLIAIFISGNLFQGISAGPQTDKAVTEVGHNPETGKVSFIGGGSPISIPGASGVRALSVQNKALIAAKIYGPQFGLKDPSQELTLSKTTDDRNGHIITRYQQVYQGIPVLGGELIFNMSSNGDLLSASGEVSSDLSLDTHPAISGETASQAALGSVAKWHKVDITALTISKPELMIFDELLLKASLRPAQLVWHMEVDARDGRPIREMVLVDAQTGAISLHINQVDTAAAEPSDTETPTPVPAPTAISLPADAQGVAAGSSEQSQNPSIGPASWYVATTGNDSYACSAAGAPCATINGALVRASAGDTIKVASGTYTGSGTYVVTISKSIQILGGWDATFANQNGQSIIDGQAVRTGIYITGTNLAVNISQITVQNTGGSDGAAVYDVNPGGTLNFTQVALINNTRNGIYNYFGNVNVTNSTISGNHAAHFGSAISSFDGHINIQFSTITNNTGSSSDYAIYSGGGQIELGNSILAGNTTGDCYANLTSDGHNIFGRSPACNNTITVQPSDQVGVNPQVGPLTTDGYHTLLAGSPAINAADPVTCPATDQRGAIRPFGANCDIGAYEFTPAGPAAAISAAGGSGQFPGFNLPLPLPLLALVADNEGEPASGVAVTFTAPASGASGTFSGSGTNTITVLTNNLGIATITTFTTNSIAGTYSITATTPGVPDIASFSITNQEFYVTSFGSDNSDCLTPATACQTINAAIGKAPGGGGISIATGTYTSSSNYAVTINKNIRISGGWDTDFTAQNGQSIIDGQVTHSGIYIQGTGLFIDISRITVQNTGGVGGASGIAIDVYNPGGTVTLNRVALINNYSYAILNYLGNINIINSTISGNYAAIDSIRGYINIQFSTITNNIRTSDYAIVSQSSQIEFGNSILAGNTPGDCNGDMLISDGHNIFGHSPACYTSITTQPSDQVGVDPRLGPLTPGGFHALLAGSPAINAADSAVCPAVDQRGVSRPQGSACDIGSYEYQPGTIPASLIIIQGSPQNIRADTAAAPDFEVAVADANGAGVPGITVTFTAPSTGASGVFSNSGTNLTTAVTGFNGAATASTFTANTTLGGYSILATVSELSTPAVFSIENLPPVDILTYTLDHDTYSIPGTFVCFWGQPDCMGGPDMDVNHATQYAYDTFVFYRTHFNRNSIDNAGMQIVSSVHYGTNYQNAFWYGDQVIYGDGYTADDIVGHELTHGVTEFTSQLFYTYQAGAINESLSDIFGEFVDQTNGAGNDSPDVKWLIGEDLPGGAIRSMSDPATYGDPDRMTSPNFYTGNDDSGGIDHNSGVNNKAAFLMTDGGSFNGRTITGIGLNKTAAIYYEVQTNLLGAAANYSDLYYAIHQACLNLVGGPDGITSGDCDQVQNAIEAVEMNIKPSQAYTPNPDSCAAGESVTSTLFSDDMESGTGKWSFGSIVGGNLWSFQTTGISSPGHSMVGAAIGVVHDGFAAMASDITVPHANRPTLYFKHYLKFHSDYDTNGNLVNAYDGGVVEYSTDQGATWNNASPLFDVGQNYNAVLATGFSNPLSGRAAFSGNSNQMVGSRYNLSSLKGQTVRFRWREGTANLMVYSAWYVDDVQIYTCGNGSVYTISGNAGVAGATLNYTDIGPQTATADGSGAYSFTVPYSWVGAVTPSKPGYAFSPDHRDYTDVLADQTIQDYTASLAEYTLTTTSAHGTVTRDPSQATYQYGDVVQLTAAPAAGWNFANWTGDASGTTNPVSVTIHGNTSVTANYTQGIYALTVTSAHGTVAKSPDQAEYQYGDVVQLTATPAAGWNFANWTGDAAGTTNPVSVTMNGDRVVTANYTPITFSISGNAGMAGTVLNYTDGTPQTAIADGSGDYSLNISYNWSGTVTPSKTGYTFSPPDKTYGNVLANKSGENYTAYAHVNVFVAGIQQGAYDIPPQGSMRVNYAGVDSGPMLVQSSGAVEIISAMRDAWAANGTTTSFAQLMGLPSSQLSDTYVFPAYNNVTLNEQLRIGNVDSSPTTVTVTIGGVVRGTYPLAANESTRVNYAGLDSGPVIVQASPSVHIIAAIRDAWAAGAPYNTTTSFVQLMGLPASQLSDTYVFPAYNNVTLNEQLRIGNVGSGPTTVTVTIGGVVRGTYPLAANESVRANYAGLDSGPVIVQASPSVHIIAAIRDAWAANGVTTSFSQLMGLPSGQLSDTYLFPAYNNVTLNEQLRIGNVSGSPTTVTVTIGGVVRGTYPLAANESVRANYAGLDSGPVVVQASPSVHIIAAVRDAWAANGVTTSFIQLMGLPNGQLSNTYLFPAYNNVTLNEQLRFGVP